ncbi:DUF975 domain-containing protein [Stenomitos frigidus]|uniref:DUF975 domain-containing protein n=1 Tax=Stenomitos frigidus ULC18 TaxID=2107698 RepID=A0A2T1DUJ8_9CYAN|nr:DUF975 domain-containing protein [Stenomitos frigidus]PSB24167.1 DUF975 domain-containing protein [Stenomitos frigidus ULC18]
MASSSNFSSSTQALSVGNVVSAGFRLYGANAKQYLTIALFGTLWLLLPFVAAIGVVLFFATVQNYYATLGLIIPALIVLFFYVLAKYLANSALIARLVFGELTDQPESLKDARRFIKPRTWSFLSASFLMGLIYMGVMIVFYLALAIVVVGLLAGLGGFQLLQNPTPETLAANGGTIALLVLLALGFLLLFIAFFLWFAARFVSFELPLAVEPGVTATQTIGRMWSLTKGSAWRIALILFITSLVTLPLQLLLQVVVSGVDVLIRVAGFTPDSPTYTALSLLITYLLSFVLSIVVLPLWQIIKTVIYYDLRGRREGLGLQLRDRGPQSDTQA